MLLLNTKRIGSAVHFVSLLIQFCSLTRDLFIPRQANLYSVLLAIPPQTAGGHALMRRAEQRRARHLGTASQTLREIDYLLGVDDESRQGALRFANREGGEFLAKHETTRIPPLIDLPKLLSVAEHFADDTVGDEELRLLLAPGSSLGGARPKASVRDRNGHLSIAKFPHKDDEIDMVLWEGVALCLAAKSGISVPSWRIENVLNKPTLLLRRFDRVQDERIPFLSAMSMLAANDNESHSYLEFVDVLRRHGANPKQDMHELWRRIVFNILISNTDDHLRNHAFLYVGSNGWRLAPAYDLNPVPTDIKPRFLTTNIDFDDNSASLDLAMSVMGYFELDKRTGYQIASEVGVAVKTWREVAARLGLQQTQINHMESPFEHEDLKLALSLCSTR